MLESLLLALSLAGPVQVNPQSPAPAPKGYIAVYDEVKPEVVAKARKLACEILKKRLGRKCPTNETQLTVLAARLDPGLLGAYYKGGSVVFISIDAPEEKVGGIMLHEITHWAMFWTNSGLAGCDSEAVAWEVYNIYMELSGRPDLVVADWKLRYPMCSVPQWAPRARPTIP